MTTRTVPREPTQEMIAFGVTVLSVTGGNTWDDVRAMWRAMFDAAPTPQPVEAQYSVPASSIPQKPQPVDDLAERLRSYSKTGDIYGQAAALIEAEAASIKHWIDAWMAEKSRAERAEAELEAAREDAERWDAMANLWACYLETTLRQDETGYWSITCTEAVENCQDCKFVGVDPDAAIDAARGQNEHG